MTKGTSELGFAIHKLWALLVIVAKVAAVIATLTLAVIAILLNAAVILIGIFVAVVIAIAVFVIARLTWTTALGRRFMMRQFDWAKLQYDYYMFGKNNMPIEADQVGPT